MDIREKLMELLSGAFDKCLSVVCAKGCEYYDKNAKVTDRNCQHKLFADHLIANGVTVQEMAYWTDVMDCGVGNCFGHCSNCHTLHKANSYAALVTEHRYCKWCGAKLLPPKGEENG